MRAAQQSTEPCRDCEHSARDSVLEHSPLPQPVRVCWPPALCPSPSVQLQWPIKFTGFFTLSVADIASGVSPPSTGYYLNTCPSMGPVSFSGLQGDTYTQLGSTTQDPFLKAGANTPPFIDLTRTESFLSELIHSSFSVITQSLELWSKNWGSQIC